MSRLLQSIASRSDNHGKYCTVFNQHMCGCFVIGFISVNQRSCECRGRADGDGRCPNTSNAVSATDTIKSATIASRSASRVGRRSSNPRFARSRGTPYDAATGRSFYAIRATRPPTVATAGERRRTRVPRAVPERRSVVRLGVSGVLLKSRRLLDRNSPRYGLGRIE